MSIIIIHQNPNLVKTGGYEKLGRSISPNTKVGYSLSVVNDKIKLDLTDAQKKLIEVHYGKKLEAADAVEFYSKQVLEPLKDDVVSWDLTNPKYLLSYGVALFTGILAADIKQIENPMCSALFYVYNSEEESNYLSELNELKGEVMYNLTKLKKEDPEKIINLAKFMFNSFEVYTPSKAYNKIIQFAEQHTKTNPTLKQIDANLAKDWKEIEMSVLIQDAINKGIIVKNQRMFYMNKQNLTEYGKNPDEIIEFLKVNPDELGEGKSTDKVYSLKRLLKQ